MSELWHNIGPEMDVPAGDIGVGGLKLVTCMGVEKINQRTQRRTYGQGS